MKKQNVTINIDGNETRSETVYNNVISNMEKMSLNKGEQIEYLKTRITELEQEQKKKFDFIVLGLICICSLIIGIALLILNFYTIGSIIVVATCCACAIKTYILASNQKNFALEKFEDVEALRKIINSKLK